jgi:hypothetical protein
VTSDDGAPPTSNATLATPTLSVACAVSVTRVPGSTSRVPINSTNGGARSAAGTIVTLVLVVAAAPWLSVAVSDTSKVPAEA